MTWYSKIKVAQNNSLESEIFSAKNEQQVRQILQSHGIIFREVKFSTGADPVFVASINNQEYVISDFDSPSMEEANNWIYTVNPANYVSTSDFSTDFWKEVQNGYRLYHGTNPENLPAIKANGLEPRNETRGIGNRGTGNAVFATRNIELAKSYGSIIEIAIDSMKNEKFMPAVSPEGPIEEKESYDALAHRLGLQYFDHEIEAGIDYDTVVIYGKIPPKYLRVLQ